MRIKDPVMGVLLVQTPLNKGKMGFGITSNLVWQS